MNRKEKKRLSKSSDLSKICRNFKLNDTKAPEIVRTKRNGKGNGILKIKKMNYENGEEYIPLCSFSWHEGIILDNAESCVRKRCSHYRAAIIEKPYFGSLATSGREKQLKN